MRVKRLHRAINKGGLYFPLCNQSGWPELVFGDEMITCLKCIWKEDSDG